MRTFPIVLAVLLCASQTAAQAACATPAPIVIAQFPPLMPGGGIQSYYCAASPAVSTVSGVTPAEWAKRAQVCTTNCSYEPIVPGDPQSRLMPVGCGPGWHSTAYLIEPPRRDTAMRTGPAPSPPGAPHMR